MEENVEYREWKEQDQMCLEVKVTREQKIKP